MWHGPQPQRAVSCARVVDMAKPESDNTPAAKAAKRVKPHKLGHSTAYVQLQKNQCFVCGPENAEGMKLVFKFDAKRQRYVCRFTLAARFVGPPGHCHGGIIATILDEAMGKVNKIRNVIALTKEMKVTYERPVPLGKPLRVESWEKSHHGRAHINVGEIYNRKGEVLARSEGLFIAIDPQKVQKMFAKYEER